MNDRVREFTEFRQRMNARILEHDNQVLRRFFALDTQCYKDGALDVRTKELLGLVASLVLRCDDCVSYHVVQCKAVGVDRAEMIRLVSHRGSAALAGSDARRAMACFSVCARASASAIRSVVTGWSCSSAGTL